MITSPCNEYTLTPNVYILKLGFTEVYIFFLFLLLKIECGRFYRLPTIYVFSKNMKMVKIFQLKIVIFTAVKNCFMLHVRVFVMIQKLVRWGLDIVDDLS